jgi:hypothetical protein
MCAIPIKTAFLTSLLLFGSFKFFFTFIKILKIMKKLFTLVVFAFLSQAALAGTGVFEYYLDTKLGSTPRSHGNYSGGLAFAGDNLGTVSTTATPLIIDLTGLKTFKNGTGDVTGANLFYRVYLTGATAPTYSMLNLPFKANLGSPGDQEWQSSTDVNLLAASLVGAGMSPGTYKVDVYIVASTNEGDKTYGTAMAPLTATFVLAVALNAEMTSFSAKKAATSTVISWLTSSEKDNALFQIERSANATDFTAIGEVKAAGNSNGVKNYTFTDATPLSGVNYYRLKAVEYSGATTTSKVVSVNFTGKGGDKMSLSPNPTHDIVRVELMAADASTVLAQITDMTGRVVLSQNVAVSKGANILPFSVSALPSGAYFVKINGEATRFVKQ